MTRIVAVVLVAMLAGAGCDQRQDSTGVRVDPAVLAAARDKAAEDRRGPPIESDTLAPLKADDSPLPPLNDAERTRSAREYRDNECRHYAQHDWSDVADRRERALKQLIAASARGDRVAVDRLLAQGADPAGVDRVYLGPLAIAAKCDRAVIVRRLLKAGAPLEGRHEWQVSNLTYRQTPLMIAAQSGADRAVAALLAAGADPDLEQLSQSGDDPRFWPSGGSLALAETNTVVRLLLKAGADPNGWPLISAAGTPDPERVRLMLQYGADPHWRDNDGLTALDHARQSRRKSPEVIAVLEAAMAARPAKNRPASRP